MSFLIDTDCVIDYLHGRRPIVEFLARSEPEGLAISEVTYAEMYEGIYRDRRSLTHARAFRRFLALAPAVPLSNRIFRRFARIRGQLRAAGRTVGDFDLLIAATALERDFVLVTRNVKDFEHVPGPRIVSP